jgi:hypothetical protein
MCGDDRIYDLKYDDHELNMASGVDKGIYRSYMTVLNIGY